MSRILPLPEDVIAQIKSTTAITALEDVVAELVKNSLDAKAAKIDVSVDFRLGACVVEDNGDGIAPDEFLDSGGLGKMHSTSNFEASSQRHGQKGIFLASLSSLALLTISSRHVNHQSQNSLTFHQRGIVSRLLPAPSEHQLQYFQHGTRVFVRDLFGNIPVRVKQRDLRFDNGQSLDKEWENLKRALVALSLFWPDDVEISVRRDNDNKRLRLRCNEADLLHTSEHLLSPQDSLNIPRTIRLLSQAGWPIGSSSSWNLVFASTATLRLDGIISLTPAPSKRVQFCAFGIQPLSSEQAKTLLLDSINKAFARSSFGMNNQQVFSDPHNPRKGSPRAPTKLLERWPQMIMRAELVDARDRSYDQHKLGIASSSEILNDLQTLAQSAVTEFLIQHGFAKRDSRTLKFSGLEHRHRFSDNLRPSNIENDIETDDTTTEATKTVPHLTERQRRLSKPTIPDQLGSNLKIPNVVFGAESRRELDPTTLTTARFGSRNDEELNLWAAQKELQGDHARPHSDSREAVVVMDSDLSIVIWSDPRTKATVTIDSRTGCVISSDTASSHQHRVSLQANPPFVSNDVSISRNKLAGAEPASSEDHWLKPVLDAWKHPTFKSGEQEIAYVDLDSMMDQRGSHSHSHSDHQRRRHADSGLGQLSLSKRGLESATVISQVDQKFVLIKTQRGSSGASTEEILVLVDQHAADERCRLEKLFEAMFNQSNQTEAEDLAAKSLNSVVHTAILDKPACFSVSAGEIDLFRKDSLYFNEWGVSFNLFEGKEKSTHGVPYTHYMEVLTLPSVIAQRCISNIPLLQKSLRSEMWLRASADTQSTQRFESQEETSTHGWLRKIENCPAFILNMLNSRACRSAIMFNDELTLEECKQLLADLSLCAFPFQCAHGRPSMVPLMNLGEPFDRVEHKDG